MSINIRAAKKEDSPIIAKNILAAMSLPAYEKEIEDSIEKTYNQSVLDKMTEIVKRDDTLYSWKNTIVAICDNQVVGSMTSYDGKEYENMRKLTFKLFEDISKDKKEAENSDMETKEGEYYLDAMAVLPEFRGRGIGKKLMRAAIENGCSLGLNVSLIVDIEKPHTKKMYEALGFLSNGRIKFFNHIYDKMYFSPIID